MQTRTRAAFVATSFYLGVAVSAAAQTTPAPGVDCSLLTATQAQGLVCATPPKPETIDTGGYVGTAPAPTEADCYPYPNPYTEADRASRCAAWQHTQIPPQALPAFTVGATYVHPYPHIRMAVLAVSRSLEGIPVVTAQFTAGPEQGQVFAFRVDRALPWAPLP